MNSPVSDQNLPALFLSADTAAVKTQRQHLMMVRTNLTLIVVGAVLTSFSVTSGDARTLLAVSGAVVFGIGLVLTGLIGNVQQDRHWFAARAVAESVKTVSWRYMMCSEPYEKSLAPADVDGMFCNQLELILHERRGIGAILGGTTAVGGQITDVMREMRASDLPTRMEVYLRDRIQLQKSWYASRSNLNAASARNWMLGIAFTQVLAVAGAMLLVWKPSMQLNPAAVFSALAAAMLAWLQVRQHQEHAHSYGLAAHELGLVAERAVHVKEEELFSVFVADAENAISREHTMWTARRDVQI
jgi:hypothetical protein